jgi:ribonucleases P/MRP protein subunit RPP40
MQFNVKKCKVMHIGKKNIRFEYSMDGVVLQTVEAEKDLGVVISHDLKISNQCMQAYVNANKMLGMIDRTIANKHSDIMMKLYKSLVRCHIEYC